MAKYPKLTQPAPAIYTAEHYRDWDEAMRQLAIANHLIQRCEKCGMPVEQLRQECDGLCEFFAGLNREFRNVQTGPAGVLKS